MGLFILVIAILIVMVMASVKFMIGLAIVCVGLGAVVRFTTRMVAGFTPSYLAALKAVALSVFLQILVVLAWMSFISHQPLQSWNPAAFVGSSLLATVSIYVAFVLGFTISLQLSFFSGVVVAVATTGACYALVMLWGMVAVAM